jgi:bifunctional dethiobiotin synthetase / adenosylmethionine---8-amino-7-oxononanoate aminotransferase
MHIFTAQWRILITPRGRHVRRFSGRSSGRVDTDCLFRYNEPVSPHLAFRRGGGKKQVFYNAIHLLDRNQHNPQVSDSALLDAITDRVSSYVRDTSGAGHVYVETAGGN